VSTVVTIQRRLGLNRLRKLEPSRPVVRYEKRCPGQLVHVDVKQLVKIARVGHRIHGDRRTTVRGIGWEVVHVAIDDRSGSATPKSCPTSWGPRLQRSWRGRSPGLPRKASVSAAS